MSSSSASALEKRSALIKSQMDRMSEEQLNRLEFFMRSHFSRAEVSGLLRARLGLAAGEEVPEEVAIVVAGLAKVFLGEVVENAMAVARELDELGVEDNEYAPLRPHHVVEAARRMREDGALWPSESAGRCAGSAPAGSRGEDGFLFDNSSPYALSSMDD